MITSRLIVTMSDNSQWAFPVASIAENRAEHFAHEFSGDVQRSLVEDTIPLFEADSCEVIDWAVGNMDLADIIEDGFCVGPALMPTADQEGWINGYKEVLDYQTFIERYPPR